MGQCGSLEEVSPQVQYHSTPGSLLPVLMRKRNVAEIVSTLCDLLCNSPNEPSAVAAALSPTRRAGAARNEDDASPLAALDVILAPGDPAMGPMLAANMHRLVDDNPASGIKALSKLLTVDKAATMNLSRQRGERWRLLVGLEVLEDVLKPLTHHTVEGDNIDLDDNYAQGAGRSNGIIERTGMLDYHELRVELRAKLGKLGAYADEEIHGRALKIRKVYFQRVSDLPRATIVYRNHMKDPDFWKPLAALPSLSPYFELPELKATLGGAGSISRQRLHLYPADLSIVLSFLQIGNMTNCSTGVARRYTDTELASPRLGDRTLMDCRAAITRFVRVAIHVLLQGGRGHGSSRLAGESKSVGVSSSTAEAKKNSCSSASNVAGSETKSNVGTRSTTPIPMVTNHNLSTVLSECKTPAGSGDWEAAAILAAKPIGMSNPAGRTAKSMSDDDSCAISTSAPHRSVKGEDEALLLKAVRALLGNVTWDLNARDAVLFGELKRLVASKLDAFAARPERRLFAALDRDVIGRIRGTKKGEPQPRQDDDGVLSLDATGLQVSLKSTILGLPPPPRCAEMVIILEYLATLLNPFFQRLAQDLGVASGGEWHGARPKSYLRMMRKLDTDHADEKWPQGCANLDILRCALTFKTPEDLVDCYENLAASKIAGGGLKLLRTKNNFSRKFNAAETLGYRSVVCNCLSQIPATWGDLFDADDSGFLPQFFTIGQEVVVGERDPLDAALDGGSISRTATIKCVESGIVHLSYGEDLDETPTVASIGDRLKRRKKKTKNAGASNRGPNASAASGGSGSGSDNGEDTELSGNEGAELQEQSASQSGPATLTIEELLELNLDARRTALKRWKVPESLRHLTRNERERLVTRLQFILFSNTALRSEKARFVTEIELLLQDYLRIRKKRHLWYRIHRADTPRALVSAMVPYAGVRHHTSFLMEALKHDDVPVVDYFSRLPKLSTVQTHKCIDDSLGYTCLHFVAARSDGLFNAILDPLLGLPVASSREGGEHKNAEKPRAWNAAASKKRKFEGVNVNYLDNDGKTARTLALETGNVRVQQRVPEHALFDEVWEILPRLFRATGGQEGAWREALGWGTNKPLARWKGVSMGIPADLALLSDDNKADNQDNHSKSAYIDETREHVLVLELGSNGLKGVVPARDCLARLPYLQQLYLNSNALLGPVPSELGRLVHLKYLYVDNNKLSGRIPTEIGNMTSLVLLGLSGNELTGPVPSELLQLTKLRELRLGYNKLTDFPWRGFAKLKFLSYLGLYKNHLAGTFPMEITRLTGLQFLSLGQNHFIGPIPEQLGLLTDLADLNLEDNAFTGHFPLGLCKLSKLKELWLNDNRLSGRIPTELGQATSLLELFLHNNNFYGTADTAEFLKGPLPDCYVSV